MNVTPQDVVAGVKQLASFPDVCIQVTEMMDDPDCSIAEIGNIISQDPALTTRLLKIVNSPFYGLASRVDTVTRAVSILGFEDIRTLVMATSSVEVFSRLSNDLVDMETFWRHSIHCGVVARILATKCNVLNAERLFIAGLLHDIGLLVMYHQLPDKSGEVITRYGEGNEELYQIENSIIGFNHCEVGYELMRNFNMPPSLCEAVAFHHEPDKASEYVLDTSIVHLANIMTNMSDLYRFREDFDLPVTVYSPEMRMTILRRSIDINYEPPFNDAAWRTTGLDATCIGEVLIKANENLEQALDLLYLGK